MKRILNPKLLPTLMPIAALLGVLLRLWTMGGGPDQGGLYASKPLAWALLWLLTAVVTAWILAAVRNLKNPGSYRKNYPRSLLSALCSLPAAVCFMVTGYGQLRSTLVPSERITTVIDTLVGIFGIIAGVCLVLCALSRMQGKKPFFLLHTLVCLYLALRLFNRCQLWSNQPQINIVIFPFLASVTLMLSAYHRAAFDVDLGNRRRSLLWGLLSVYFSVIAMLSMEQPLFYGMCALWMIADLCCLRPLKPKVEIPEEAPVEEAPQPPVEE